jgi:hypothetical protein
MSLATYYINAPTLATATGVYIDEGLTICAPNGYYQEDSLVRELVNCVLLPQQICPACAFPCGVTIDNSGGQGDFIMNINLTAGIGAVIVYISPYTVPKGVIAKYNNVAYNELSSPTYGYLSANSQGLVTYIGETSSDCGLVAGSPYQLQVYRYNGTTFDISTGEIEIFYINLGQLALTASGPGQCVMVIPKTVAAPTTLELKIVSACTSSAFQAYVSCPAALTGFTSKGNASENYFACALTESFTYYSAPVNGNGVTLGLYDWVFYDANGQNVLPNGYYYAPASLPGGNDWYQVENGVIIDFGLCTSPPLYNLGYNCSNNIGAPCDLSITALTLTATSGVTTIFTSVAPGAGTVAVNGGIYDISLGFTFDALYPSCCEMELVIIYIGVEIASLYIGIPVDGQYYELNTSITVSSVGLLTGVLRCI